MSEPAHPALRRLAEERPQLIAYLTAITGDPSLSDDVVQDLTMLVLRKGDAVPLDAGFAGWIRTAARFEAFNAMRRLRKGHRRLDDAACDRIDHAWRTDEDRGAPEAEVAALRACVERLAPEARRILALRYEGGTEVGDLAVQLGRPADTIYKILARAHRFLADCVRGRLESS